ncbi:HAD family hydrolase [Amycolatopsis sp. CA-230715]|uniref:HAD family hydrolase n=1 Tax=Amycolatopsis sp. CA-230715 TaxID=2745196 RepID=UPI001C3421E3|nr:HAD-IA family hydrolase [Amycolatopsis sp. CA-230715]QWF82128.1 Phosphoglycolate phosphatase [Amycolatopsis sp. CA-230715]
MDETWVATLAKAQILLLDFDGPVCSVFAGVPAAAVATQLRSELADSSPADDPFAVLRFAATVSAEQAAFVEAALTAHEVEAIKSAEPTPGAHELIAGWHASGRPLAIVSNNSRVAIESYLDLYGLRGSIDCIAAREGAGTPLKPDPYLVTKALTALDAEAKQSVLIGDSPSDVDAAVAAGVTAIGYANKPGKRLALAKAAAITETLV